MGKLGTRVLQRSTEGRRQKTEGREQKNTEDRTFVQGWVAFDLWPGQEPVLGALQVHRQVIILKARQLGMTWLVLGYFLHRMLFAPAWTGLLFSRRDDEAMELLSEERLKGMYSRLPEWMRCRSVMVDNAHEWVLSNGSRALAFPTTAGDSYTANAVLVDEADLVPNLNRLMRSVKPTIDNGGQIILLSRADKETPLSEFKQIYRAAKRGGSALRAQRAPAQGSPTGWHPIFLPWSVHPGRDEAWYAAQRLDAQNSAKICISEDWLTQFHTKYCLLLVMR